MKTIYNMKKKALRLCALVLTVATLLTLAPTAVFATDTKADSPTTSEALPKIIILHEGAQKLSITLKELGEELLTTFTVGTQSKNITWQICTPDGKQWVNISGKSGETLRVTYALIESMLDSRERARIRCRLVDGEDTYYSEPVEIIMSYGAELPTEPAESAVALHSLRKNILRASETDSGDLELVTVVINYSFDNGGIAFEPYGASIAKGSDFHTTVDSPSVAGYAPFMLVNGEYIDAKTVNIDYSSIEESVVINVIYLPALVDYQVHHHFQDIYDDAYSEVADVITTAKALTGSTTPTSGLELALPGFRPLSYEAITVAADGSTIVEIRYDRNYYLISFEMDGGYGTEPIYTRFGTEVGANDPIKHGYRFDGWVLTSYNENTPTTSQASQYDINSKKLIIVPDANLTYTAKWITLPTTYTMVFWCENINDNGFTYMGNLDNIPAMSGDTVDGSDRISEAKDIPDSDMFTYCDARTDKNVIVEGDGSTIVNVYYTRNRYAITFKANAKCAIPVGHTHTRENCYIAMCNGGHTHTAECSPTLTCKVEEHTAHTDACIACGIEAHRHSSACCGLGEHTHTKDCWAGTGYWGNPVGNVTNKPNRAPANPENGYVYGSSWSSKAIYINGSWYTYSGMASSGDIADPGCDQTQHTHGTSGCSCKLSEHTHTASCYKDTLHSHNESCYKYSCGTQTHEHSDSCYLLNCGIPEKHSHNNNCNSSSKSNTVKIVYKKYQEDISDIWPVVDDNGKTYNSGERWMPSDSSYYSQVLVFLANMPGDDFTLTLNTSSNDTYTMQYYLQVLPDDVEAGNYDTQYNGKYFKLYTEVKANYNYLTEAEDFFEINGYQKFGSNPAFKNGQVDINGGGVVKMYYTRNVTQSLDFRSNGDVIASHTGIMFGENISQFSDFVPEYPDNLEANAYTFGGWYTSPGHYPGTEVDWSTATMSAGDVMYYAKWEPIVHKINVYLTSELDTQIGSTQYVSHRNFATAPTDAVVNGNYVFQGWFYTETVDGQVVEKAFVFNGIPIISDMNIYAKWSSHVSVDYTINYVFVKRDANGNEISSTVVADPMKGTAIAGHNKTFYAKAGEELYAGYEKGYYPLTNSHTVTMSVDGNHVFTFEYVYVESMPYGVRYVNKTTGAQIHPDKKVYDNTLSVVTETFVSATGMMPDAYQKRLVLSASGEDADEDGILDNNMLTFYYTENTTDAFYRVVHYIHDINDNNYREYRSEEKIGPIGESFTVNILNITGFSCNGALTKIDGVKVATTGSSVTTTLGKNGTLVELYYDRVNVEYTVKYLEDGTNKVLHEEKKGQGIFGGQIVEDAPKLTHKGYSLVSDQTRYLVLSTNSELNVITFYYKESTYSMQYVLVGSTEGASLSMISENVNAVTGTPQGSVPYVKEGYRFIGWYADENCTIPIDDSFIGEDLRLTPQKTEAVWLSNQVFYAKVEPNFTNLTISVSGVDDIDKDQIFIYRIQGTSEKTKDVDLTVTVSGNSSVTVVALLLGDYTVTELSDWSCRYMPDAKSKSISLSVDKNLNTLRFNHARTKDKWLDGNNDIVNNFN